jgi:hypothetical protein
MVGGGQQQERGDAVLAGQLDERRVSTGKQVGLPR